MYKINQTTLDSIIKKTVSHKNIHGAVFHLASKDDTLSLQSAQGNIGLHDPFYIASINKLMISALTLRLCRDSQLNLADTLSKYLPEELLKGLLMHKGIDYSGKITIQHLISHTSGFSCYLVDKRADGKKNMDLILNGNDQSWPFEAVVAEMKKKEAKFAPGTPGKAHYSETNFRLMGRILEVVTNKPLKQLLQDFFTGLGMKDTFVLPSGTAAYCAPVYYKQNEISIEKYWTSTHHDIASTAQDLMIFLKAFFSGSFYPENKMAQLEKWNNIFLPFKYGIGIQQFYLPRIFSPFKAVPKIIGHCGSAGSMAFYIPEKNVFITGTVNQTSNVNIAFHTLMKIVNKI